MHSKNRRLSRPRSSFVVTFGAAAIVGACGGSAVGNPAGIGSDAGDDSGNPAGCPASAPSASSSCTLPDGTSCSYGGGCNPAHYACNGGQWSIAISNPPRPSCPLTEPTPGTACDPCVYPSTLHCPYTIGMCQGQPIQGEGVCIANKWQIVGGGSCNPPAVDGGSPPDASAPTEAGRD